MVKTIAEVQYFVTISLPFKIDPYKLSVSSTAGAKSYKITNYMTLLY